MRCKDHKIALRVVSGALAEEYVSAEDQSRSTLFPNKDHHLLRAQARCRVRVQNRFVPIAYTNFGAQKGKKQLSKLIF